MTGKILYNNIRLARAYDEGYRGDPATNPHANGSPAYLAYAAGADQRRIDEPPTFPEPPEPPLVRK